MPNFVGFGQRFVTPALPTPVPASPLSGLVGTIGVRIRISPLNRDMGFKVPSLAATISLPANSAASLQTQFYDDIANTTLAPTAYVTVEDSQGVPRRKQDGTYASLIPVVANALRLSDLILPPNEASIIVITVQPLTDQQRVFRQAVSVTTNG